MEPRGLSKRAAYAPRLQDLVRPQRFQGKGKERRRQGQEDHCEVETGQQPGQAWGAGQGGDLPHRRQGMGRTFLETALNAHGPPCDQQLDDGEHCGQGQIEDVGGLAVDFHFQGGVAKASQKQDHAEGAEAEDEDEQACRGDGRGEQRKSDRAEGLPWRGAGHLGGLGHGRVEVSPEGGDDAQGQTEIEEDMGCQDEDEALLLAGRDQAQARDQTAEEGVRVGQGAEGRGHDHRGEHEGDGHQAFEEALAGEVVAGQEVGAGQCRRQGQQAGQGRLPEGEEDDPGIVGGHEWG